MGEVYFFVIEYNTDRIYSDAGGSGFEAMKLAGCAIALDNFHIGSLSSSIRI